MSEVILAQQEPELSCRLSQGEEISFHITQPEPSSAPVVIYQTLICSQTHLLLYCSESASPLFVVPCSGSLHSARRLGEWEKAKQLLSNIFLLSRLILLIAPLSQRHKRRLYIWTSPDGRHQNQTDYILCSQRCRSSIQSAKTRQGADCGSSHEFFIAKFRLKLKKVEKTTKPFMYDLNQNPYDYTVEVRNRFKGLDVIDSVPDELWKEICDIVQETGIKIIPKKRKCKKAKWLSEKAFQIAVKRREVKSYTSAILQYKIKIKNLSQEEKRRKGKI